MTSARVVIALLGFLGAIFFPPWVPAICMVLLSLRFRSWEVPLMGLLVDFLWHVPGTGVHFIPFFTVGAIVIVWGLEPLRQEFLSV